ncbi:hypothetical protein BGX38DRAFT_1174539 [Terfezia claveryi]|nr:hypothetical protein BGX38DRAFT_1174539 [Terfezia claveryi]
MIPESPIVNQEPPYLLNNIYPQSLDNPSQDLLLPSLLTSIYLPAILAYGVYYRQLFCHHPWLGLVWSVVVCGILGWIGVLLGFARDAWAAIGLGAAGMVLIVACGRTEAADLRKIEEQKQGQTVIEQ